jgi:hypothetical protein
MRGRITEDMVALLGRAAGFELAPERCKLLAPQLDWLFSEAENLASLDLSHEEPISIFLAGVFTSFGLNDSWPSPEKSKTQGKP